MDLRSTTDGGGTGHGRRHEATALAALRLEPAGETSAVLEDVVLGFVQRVYSDCGCPRRARQVFDRIPADTFRTLSAYVEGHAGFSDVCRVFSIGRPCLAGLYFPDPHGDEISRWCVAAGLAIEAIVALRTAQ